MARWTAAQIEDQTGRSFVVTGANTGLGFETARQLAAHGGRVVLTARSEAKGEEAVGRLRAEIPDARVEYRLLDLADLDSVRRFADALIAGGEGIDVLVNNAGVMFPPRVLTRQGFESQFATNHLGHFALTGLVFDLIRQGRDARVVTVSSLEHKGGAIHFRDLTGERSYGPRAFYRQSKFANVLFALELDRRVRAGGDTGPLRAGPSRLGQHESADERSHGRHETAHEDRQSGGGPKRRDGCSEPALCGGGPLSRERGVLRPSWTRRAPRLSEKGRAGRAGQGRGDRAPTMGAF